MPEGVSDTKRRMAGLAAVVAMYFLVAHVLPQPASMTAAGIASSAYSPRTIGAWSGVLSSTTAIAWGALNWAGRLPEPKAAGVDPKEVEVHGDPTV